MTKDFSEVMSQRSDKELADILTVKRDDYQPEAISAAQSEFDKRKLDINNIVTNMTIPETMSDSKAQENVGLTITYKILTLLMPAYGTVLVRLFCVHILKNEILSGLALPVVIITQILIFRNLRNNNQEKIALDFKKWTTYSWMFFGSLFIIIFILVIILESNPRH